MKKAEVLHKLFSLAKTYETKLRSVNLLILYIYPDDGISYKEMIFYKDHFKHLTGVRSTLSAKEFYSKCLDQRMDESSFELAKNGTTVQKIKVLDHLFSIRQTATMIGSYQEDTRIQLKTDLIAGSTTGFIGFVKNKEYYVPNTAISDDIRNNTERYSKISAIFSKKTKDNVYGSLDQNRGCLCRPDLPENIKSKLSDQIVF